MAGNYEDRVRKLEKELQELKIISSAAAESSRAKQDHLLKRLKAKDAECESLRIHLDRTTAEFADYRNQIEKRLKVQVQAFSNHNEQVQSLKTLAARDRAWLDEETSRRRAASVALRKATEEKATRLRRRISTGW